MLSGAIGQRINNLNLRFIIYASLGAPLLLLWLAAYLAWSSWIVHASADKTMRANEMADMIITAASLHALERGLTATALGAGAAPGGDLIEKIRDKRERGDKFWKDAAAHATLMIRDYPDDSSFTVLLRQTQEAYQKLADARARVDRTLSGNRAITAEEWITAATQFIDLAARLRMRAFSDDSDTYPQEISKSNLTVKQFVWMVSEYAGRERANVAALISGGTQASPEVLQRLAAFRAIVDLSMRDILFLRDLPDTDPLVVSAIREMEKNFLGTFNETRTQVYAQAVAGSYTLSAGEWVKRSTEAINSILAVSEAASRVNRGKAEKIAIRSYIQMWGYIGVFVGMLVMTLIALWLLKVKLDNLAFLRDSMVVLSAGEGDLTKRLDIHADDEIGRTSSAFNMFIEKLQAIIREINSAVEQVVGAATLQSEIAEKVSISSRQQFEAASGTAISVEEITGRYGQIAGHTQETAEASRAAGEQASQGEKVVHDASTEMKEIAESVGQLSGAIELLGKRSDEIGGIVNVIKEIADQTNLLALNAAIEAARAGEQGRGFAVVADEVRKLAERTSSATADITGMTNAIQAETERAVKAMRASSERAEQGVRMADQAAESLANINLSTKQIAEKINSIASATQEQTAAGNQIAESVEQISRMAEQSNDTINEVWKNADQLKALAANMQAAVGRFKV
ncbi:MAG: methyl-accepting chemotaxis protein [Betaproteobacteria bacterium]|nr:methyl-accepting chemotaxis protein [Betaproteobacteria bacterium]